MAQDTTLSNEAIERLPEEKQTIEYFVNLARNLYNRDRNLRDMQQAMDRMVRMEYELPVGLRHLKWMQKWTSSAPYDAYKAARRVLTGLDERPRLVPAGESARASEWANDVETTLKWQFDQATLRRPSLREDIIGSSVKYDEIVGSVIHIPTQMKAKAKIGADTRRYQVARRFGDFAINLRNPKQVHTIHSQYMMEGGIEVVKMTLQELVMTWGNRVEALKTELRNNPEMAHEPYILFDAIDLDARAVWAVKAEDEPTAVGAHPDERLIILGPEPNDYPFINLISVLGGDSTEEYREHQRQPLLYPVYRAEQWMLANLMGSLTFSEALAEMGQPKVKVVGPAPSRVRASFGHPGGRWEVPVNHDVVDMQDREADPALREMWDRFVGEIQGATLPRILVTAEPQPGETFSGLNLRVQTAIAQLLPYKRLAERFYTGAYRQMLYWSHYTGTDIKGFVVNRSERGRQITIDSEEIDPQNLFLNINLEPDEPTDRNAKITATINLSERMNVPAVQLLEELGYTDPQRLMREWAKEQVRFAYMRGKLEQVARKVSGEYQQDVVAAAQQMLQGMQEETAPVPGVLGGGGNGRGDGRLPLGAQGVMGAGGPESNPASGGTPAIQQAPGEATFESVLGADRSGLEIV